MSKAVYAGWDKEKKVWEIWKAKKDVIKGQKNRYYNKGFIDNAYHISRYLNRPLNKKKIYKIVTMEA